MIPFSGSPNEFDSQLQRTIMSVTSAGTDSPQPVPHHPITCNSGKLYYEEDGAFHCEHAAVGPDDSRTGQAVNHSLALLIIELAMAL